MLLYFFEKKRNRSSVLKPQLTNTTALLAPKRGSKTGHERRHTLGFLAEISFTPLLYHPGGFLGCPEKQTSSRNYNLFV
jgi:hypothetical protein